MTQKEPFSYLEYPRSAILDRYDLVCTHGGPMPSHLVCPQSYFTQCIRHVPRIGSHDVQWVPWNRDTLQRRRIHLHTGVRVGPTLMAMSHGFVGS